MMNPPSAAMERLSRDAGTSGMSANVSATNNDRSVRKARDRFSCDAGTAGGAAARATTASRGTACSSISSKRVISHPPALLLARLSQRQIFYVDFVEQVFLLPFVPRSEVTTALRQLVIRIDLQYIFKLFDRVRQPLFLQRRRAEVEVSVEDHALDALVLRILLQQRLQIVDRVRVLALVE